MKKTTIAIILIVCLLAATAAVLANEYFFKMPTSGYVETDYGLTANQTSIDWGPENVTIGNPVIRSVNFTNTGTKNFTSLTITYGDESSNLINFDLGCDAVWEPLAINQSIIANFTLTIYEATQGHFSFDIYVSDST